MSTSASTSTTTTATIAKETAAERRKRIQAEIAASNAAKKERLAAAKKARSAAAKKQGKTEDRTAAVPPELPTKKGKKAEKAAKLPKASKPSKAERDAARAANLPAPTVKVQGTDMAPGVEIATELDKAFAYLNERLFDNKVEPCVVVVSKLKRSWGHFWHSQFARRLDLRNRLHEIGIDFTRIGNEGKGDIDVLSTIAHEMAHALVYQIDKAEAAEAAAAKVGGEFKPKTYHCGVWAALMDKIGLTPIAIGSNGQPTGKKTGQNATHEIVKGGPFEVVSKELLATGFKFNWSMVGGYYDEMGRPVRVKIGKGGKMSIAIGGEEGEGGEPKVKKARAGAKAVHVCPHCSSKAWGKPSLVITCKGTKDAPHEPTEMECDRDTYEGDVDGQASKRDPDGPVSSDD